MFFFLIPIILGGLVAGKLAAKNGKHIYVFLFIFLGGLVAGKLVPKNGIYKLSFHDVYRGIQSTPTCCCCVLSFVHSSCKALLLFGSRKELALPPAIHCLGILGGCGLSR